MKKQRPVKPAVLVRLVEAATHVEESTKQRATREMGTAKAAATTTSLTLTEKPQLPLPPAVSSSPPQPPPAKGGGGAGSGLNRLVVGDTADEQSAHRLRCVVLEEQVSALQTRVTQLEALVDESNYGRRFPPPSVFLPPEVYPPLQDEGSNARHRRAAVDEVLDYLALYEEQCASRVIGPARAEETESVRYLKGRVGELLLRATPRADNSTMPHYTTTNYAPTRR